MQSCPGNLNPPSRALLSISSPRETFKLSRLGNVSISSQKFASSVQHKDSLTIKGTNGAIISRDRTIKSIDKIQDLTLGGNEMRSKIKESLASLKEASIILENVKSKKMLVTNS